MREKMVPLLVSVAAGGLVVGLLVGAIGLLVVRSAAPGPTNRHIVLVEDGRRGEQERRSVA